MQLGVVWRELKTVAVDRSHEDNSIFGVKLGGTKSPVIMTEKEVMSGVNRGLAFRRRFHRKRETRLWRGEGRVYRRRGLTEQWKNRLLAKKKTGTELTQQNGGQIAAAPLTGDRK